MSTTKFPGVERIKTVYPVWLVIYLLLIILMLYFKILIPNFIFWLSIIFLGKTVLLDYKLVKFRARPRAYWLDHGPLFFLLMIIGILGLLDLKFFQGYINLPTIIISTVGFLLDLYKDLKENPSVYER